MTKSTKHSDHLAPEIKKPSYPRGACAASSEQSGKHSGRPPYYDTPEDMQAATDRYFEHCHENDEPITRTGLALFLGFSSLQSLDDAGRRPGFSDVVARGKLRVQEAYERRLSKREQARGAEFVLKNMGWEDRTVHENYALQQVVITDEPMSIEDYRQKYQAGHLLIEGEAEECDADSGDRTDKSSD